MDGPVPDLREEAARRVRERELILLGAMLANPELRTLIAADWPTLGMAYEDVTPARDENRARLADLLREVGVDWEPSQGSPVEAIRRHVIADGRIQRAIGSAQNMADFARVGQMLPLADKAATLEALANWWQIGRRYFEEQDGRTSLPRKPKAGAT